MAKKETGTSIVKWEEEFKEFAKQTAQGAKAAEGKFITFSGGRMKFGGSDIPDDEIRCVIVGWVHHNVFYDPKVRFDPKNPSTPICYSFGVEPEEISPHEAATDKQCGSCAECPMNEFGSSKTGEGKACKNTIRLALIAESDLEDISTAEVVYASIPPTSRLNWMNYVKKDLLDKVGRPHWAVITLMKRVPDSKSQFKIEFTNEALIEDSKLFGPLKDLWDTTMNGIDFPYQAREAKEDKKGGKEKPAKFARR